MRSPLAKLKPYLVDTTAKARERYAADTLALDKVRAFMTEAAQKGESAVRVVLTMNVRGTDAARALEEWAKKEEFIFTWEIRPIEKTDGPRETVFEPELRWIESGIR